MSESSATPDVVNPNPDPTTWPECGLCRLPYVLRRVLTLSNGGEYKWLWVRDCRHTKAPPVAGGEVES